MESQNSASPVASRVLERGQMGIIIMVGNLYSACASEAEEEFSARPLIGKEDPRKQQEMSRK